MAHFVPHNHYNLPGSGQHHSNCAEVTGTMEKLKTHICSTRISVMDGEHRSLNNLQLEIIMFAVVVVGVGSGY